MSVMANLLQEEEVFDSSLLGEFSIKKEVLSDLFQPDNIRDGESIKKIGELGGVKGLCKAVKTTTKKGIDTSDVSLQQRKEFFGENENITKPPKTFWELIVDCLGDDLLRILCAAAFVSLVIGCIRDGIVEGWIDGMGIFIAVIIIVTITSINNYMKDKQFRLLNAQAALRDVCVIRNGEVLHVSIFSLLVGDIMQIQTGEIFPVDGFLFKGNKLVCDESSITGETDPVKKYPIGEAGKTPSPFLIAGSQVVEGSGEMIILAVGRLSSVGKQQALMAEQDEEEKKTPLQLKLDVFVDQIGKIGVYWAFITFFAMFLNLLITLLTSDDPNVKIFTLDNLSEVIDYFIVGVTVIVIAVPEGLPLAVTLSLAYAVGKMKDENNLVRTLDACETMGGVDAICSDKTGTLTENRMKVTRLFALDQTHTDFVKSSFNSHFVDIFTEGLCVNANAYPTINGNGKFEQIGNKTECALLELAYEFGVSFKDYRPSDNIIRIIPFSSDRKRMSTIYHPKENNSKVLRVYSKGAPDVMLDFCNRFMNKNGQTQAINSEFIAKLQETQKQFADNSLRTLLIAYKEFPEVKPENLPEDQELEKELIVLGMVGIQDPLRKGIKEAINTCKRAGVTVRMVTGDNVDTAIAISKEAGIIEQNYSTQTNQYAVMEGKQFRQLVGGLKDIRSDDGRVLRFEVGDLDKFREIIPHLRVLARSTPDDKFLLVTGLQKCGSVVAVTGDGTNDAPALKKADIGFAMGIAGTEVAKEAAGIILIDDNFSSTITAIKWGRNIFDCIRKFLSFQLTINIVALFMAFLGGVTFRESPLNTIQILWVNLMQDTMAALALATEPPSDELLLRKPVKRNEVIVTASMWKNLLLQSLYQIAVLMVVLFFGPQIFGVEYGIHNKNWTEDNGQHLTIFFNIFVFLSVFNEINCRKLKPTEVNVFEGFFNNPLFLFILASTVLVQMLMVELGGRAAKCSPLSLQQNFVCILIGASSVLAGIVIRMLPQSIDNVLNKTNPFREKDPIDDDSDHEIDHSQFKMGGIKQHHPHQNVEQRKLGHSDSVEMKELK